MTAVISVKSVVIGGEKWKVVGTQLTPERKIHAYVVERKKKQKIVSVEASK